MQMNNILTVNNIRHWRLLFNSSCNSCRMSVGRSDGLTHSNQSVSGGSSSGSGGEVH